MKPLRLFTLIALAALMLPAMASASEDLWGHTVKEAADATWQPPLEWGENDTLAAATTDLDTDWAYAFWPAGADLLAEPLAIKRYTELTGIQYRTYTYVLLKQRRVNDGYFDILALKLDADGNKVLTFGVNGFKRLDVGFDTVGAATFGSGGFETGPQQTFFAGSKWAGTLLDFDMAVACFDLSTSSGKCSGWNSTSTTIAMFDYGGWKADVANVIEYDPDGYIFIAGKVSRNSGIVIGAAKIKTANGLFDTSWGVDSGRTWYALNGENYDPEILASAFAHTGTPGGKRFYIAGSLRPGSDANDRDGFVLSVNTATGQYFEKRAYWEGDNTGWKKDAVTALTVLKTGKLAYAGWSETDNASFPSLLLGRLKAVEVTSDGSFCGGGLCIHEVGGPFYLGAGIRDVLPRAIAERKMNGDLVVALDGQRRSGIQPPYTWSSRQMLHLWNSRGSQRYASASNAYSASGAAAAWSGPLLVSDSDVLLAGKRRYTDTNHDVTVARHLRLDSIFAHDFGGSTSD